MRRAISLLAMLAGLSGALPAGAAAYLPDAQLMTPDGAAITAPGQIGIDRIRAGESKDFQFFAVNLGTSPDNITIDGCGPTRLARVRYEIAGPGVVTDEVATGTYYAPGFPANSGFTIETRITAKARAERGDHIRCRFEVISGLGGISDSVLMRFDVR